jgi:hypothetical protein
MWIQVHLSVLNRLLLWEDAPMNYNRILVRGSRLVVLGAVALILVFTNRSFAAGAYQRTEDERLKADVTGSTAPADSSNLSLSTLNSQASAPLIAQASTEADESATPRQQPVTKKAALAPGAVRAIERPDRQPEKKVEKPKETAPKVRKSATPEEPKAEPTVIDRELASPAEGPTSVAAEKAQTPTPKSQEPSQVSAGASLREELSTTASEARTTPQPSDSPVDDSIRTLTGPPSSLRTKPEPETTPAQETSVPTTAASTSLSAEPKLNAVQAMDIADIEARTRGYDLGEYQLPKAEYDAATDMWSVSYITRDGAKKAKRLRVTVQDKSGQADVKK